ncbi:GGDEF domain-containing protein [Roseateles cellulosilyticus]|uniref:diguanylate cyclase n=1 Tax=Pelomonas cellulosilytica TaxID=2906762 RepID=A0ABS8Y129_9BURK|nr:GGDEF domain-containing protein [Pelomonas sp. P8]MCE4555435.1 GGDEF domain-containing protein [Pelomonas sp. P8]
MISLDISTVLFLYQSSLLVGAAAFLLNRRQTGPTRGLGMVSAALGILGIGAALASLGEQARLPRHLWTLATLCSGLWGHALLAAGLACLSQGRPPRHWKLLWLWPAPFWLLAALTQFHLHNPSRAIAFHLNAAVCLALAAWVIWRGRRLEPLPSREPLALVLLATSLSFAAGAAVIRWVDAFVPWLALEFFVQILGNFSLVILVGGMTTDRAEAHLRRQACLDPLTGIGNRRWLADSVPATLKVGDTVLCLDLDHFKQINDLHGHAGGDLVLVAAANVLREGLRQGDCLARVGGEEFVLFLPELDERQALLLAERLRAAIETLAVPYRGQVVAVTASLGIARCGQAGQDWQELHHAADTALYAAKQAGRNRVQLAGAESRTT